MSAHSRYSPEQQCQSARAPCFAIVASRATPPKQHSAPIFAVFPVLPPLSYFTPSLLAAAHHLSFIPLTVPLCSSFIALSPMWL